MTHVWGGKELQVLGSACMPSPQYKSPLPQNPPDEQHVPPVHVAWAAAYLMLRIH